MLALAIVFISLALCLYSLGVWAERIARRLRAWHLAAFWAGFACDSLGTGFMRLLASASGSQNPLHALSGLAAICLMLVHAVWASIVLARGREEAKRRFHRFSLFVWLVWLVPYVSGAAMAMSR